mgnify:CR=1 FL=1|tara:strand:- start:4144 stop:5142 length:999 start_codon:yes stop_codon:yes gene_type:complete
MSSKPKILYGINGTGWGHLTRANALIPELKNFADVDVLVSGKMQNLELDVDVKYNFKGFRFYYKKGSVDIIKTLRKFDYINAFKDISSLNVKQYDFVVSDFEPITAWSCFFKKHPYLQVSHQASFLSKLTPRPKNTFLPLKLHGEFTLQYFAYSKNYIGVHFDKYDKHILPPLLRDKIYHAKDTVFNDHISVYLPAYETKRLIDFFSQFPNYNFEIFSLDCKKEFSEKNLKIFPLSDYFIESIISSSGCISSAGFEANAEALYLKKPLLSIPIKYQYEQACNAAALKKLGVKVISDLDFDLVKDWLANPPYLPKLEVSTSTDLAKAILNYKF